MTSESDLWEPTHIYPFAYQASGGEGKGCVAWMRLGAGPGRKSQVLCRRKPEAGRRLSFFQALSLPLTRQDFPRNSHISGHLRG